MATTDTCITIDDALERKALDRTHRYLHALLAHVDRIVALVPEADRVRAEELARLIDRLAGEYAGAELDAGLVRVLRQVPVLADERLFGDLHDAMMGGEGFGLAFFLGILDSGPDA